MKKFIALLLALCLVLLLGGCMGVVAPMRQTVRGSGNVAEHITPLTEPEEGFALRLTGISLRNANDVTLVIDETLDREIVVETDSNIAEFIEVSLNERLNEISIDVTRNVFLSPTRLNITVGAPVRALFIDGAWRFRYNGPSVASMNIELNGAANGEMAFGELESLTATLNGASKINMQGAARQANLTLNGASNIHAFDLLTEYASVTINGAGSCEIAVEQNLNAVINGLGNVFYDGNPTVSRQINGLGRVQARN